MSLFKNQVRTWSKDQRVLLTLVTLNLILLVVISMGNQFGASNKPGNLDVISFPFTNVIEFQIIEPGQSPFTFIQQPDGDWLFIPDGLQEFPARNSRVVDFLRTLEGLEVLRLVSTQGEGNDFGFGTPSSRRIVGKTSENLSFDLEFGIPSARGGEQFLRIEPTPIIYGVSSTLGFFLNQGSSYWTELRLWPEGLPQNEILGFRINYQFFNPESFIQDQLPNGSIRWVQTQGIQDQESSTQEEISRRARELLTQLTSLEFSSLLLSGQPVIDLRPEFQVGEFFLQATAARSWTLELYDVGDSNYRLRIIDSNGFSRVGEIPRWRFSNF